MTIYKVHVDESIHVLLSTWEGLDGCAIPGAWNMDRLDTTVPVAQ